MRPSNALSRYFTRFLMELMARKRRLPSQLALDIGVSHATVSRWLEGQDIPSTRSCQRLAEYSSIPLEKILALAGHMPQPENAGPVEWPDYPEGPPLQSGTSSTRKHG